MNIFKKDNPSIVVFYKREQPDKIIIDSRTGEKVIQEGIEEIKTAQYYRIDHITVITYSDEPEHLDKLHIDCGKNCIPMPYMDSEYDVTKFKEVEGGILIEIVRDELSKTPEGMYLKSEYKEKK